MDAETILDRFAREQGWNLASQVTVLLRYIDNQERGGDYAAFREFLTEQQDMENN
jgi:hypothetical protein